VGIYLFIWLVNCPGLLVLFSRSWWGVEVEAGTRREVYYGSYAGQRRSTDRKMGTLWLCPLPQTRLILESEKTWQKTCFLLQQQRVLKWQLAHPNGTVDECIGWMKQSQSKRQKVESSTWYWHFEHRPYHRGSLEIGYQLTLATVCVPPDWKRYTCTETPAVRPASDVKKCRVTNTCLILKICRQI
jgi:hypothetical protein